MQNMLVIVWKDIWQKKIIILGVSDVKPLTWFCKRGISIFDAIAPRYAIKANPKMYCVSVY